MLTRFWRHRFLSRGLARDLSIHIRRAMKPGPLVWVDCEMTGLNHKTDRIIEICCLVTDGQLKLVEEQGYERAIQTPPAALEAMDDWCQTTHKKSGLYERALASTTTLEQADAELLAYLEKHMEKGMGVLAGNTVHMDRLFMLKDFPKTVEYLHYRLVDVSSFKEVGYRHNPKLMRKVPKKAMSHTARADILESISELQWYTENYLVAPAASPQPVPGETTTITGVSETLKEIKSQQEEQTAKAGTDAETKVEAQSETSADANADEIAPLSNKRQRVEPLNE